MNTAVSVYWRKLGMRNKEPLQEAQRRSLNYVVKAKVYLLLTFMCLGASNHGGRGVTGVSVEVTQCS